MKSRTLIVFAFACALLAVWTGAAAEMFPRSLVSRMMDARDGFKAPAKAMRVEADVGADPAQWPFDVARVERLLEQALVRAEDGTYRLKRDDAGGDARARIARALAYVNKVIAEWAILSLDAKFARCDAATVKALAGYRVDTDPNFWDAFAILTRKGLRGGGSVLVGGWITGWKITDRIYLLLTSELAKDGCPRDYQFVMWDGRKDWPIMGFDTFPDAARALTALRIKASPAAANNLAALLHARDANRALYMPEYVETLLRRAATAGCDCAFYNLGVIMEEQGNLEQARAFFSRTTAK